MNNSSENWAVEYNPTGREGYLFYHEESRELPFYWEYGGGNTVVIVRILEPGKFALRYPWAVEHKRQIFERVATELLRRAPGCKSDIEEETDCIYVRKLN